MTLETSVKSACRRSFGIALIASVLYAFSGIFFVPLLAPDEIRVAEIGREMHVTGDWLVPRLGGEPFLEQPPLYYAAVATSFSIFGVTDGTARIPTALATVATLLLAFDMARRLGGPVTGLLALAVLATLGGFFRYSHRCMVDSWLTLFVTLGYWAWLRALLGAAHGDTPDAGRGATTSGTTQPAAASHQASPPSALVLLLYVAATLGFLVKGPVALVLLFGPLGIDMLFGRRWWLLRSWAHVGGALLMAAGVCLWPWLLLEHVGRDAFDTFVQGNIVGRIAPDESYRGGHQKPPWFYLGSALTLLLPWILAVPLLARWCWRGWRARRTALPTRSTSTTSTTSAGLAAPATSVLPSLDALTSVALLFPVGLLLLSLPATKRDLYLMPLLPPMAVALGAWLGCTAAPGRSLGLKLAGALSGLAIVAQFSLPLLPDSSHNMTSLATGLRDMGMLNESFASWKLDERSSAVVPFRTGHIVHDMQEEAELKTFLAEHAAARLLVPDDRLSSLPAGIEPRLRLLQCWMFGDNGYAVYALSPAAVADELR